MKSLVRVAATIGGAALGSVLGNWLFGISLWLGVAVSAIGVVVIGYVEARSNEARRSEISGNGVRSFLLKTTSPPDALNAEGIAERLTERSERFVMDEKGYRQHATI